MEAWSAGTPVVVNARCDVTREHCERSSGGLWFDDYAKLESVLERLMADHRLRAELSRQGAGYVERHYRWPVVIERYRAFLTALG
jgi:glycosyltransferase involved in cell wall biosynthesis